MRTEWLVRHRAAASLMVTIIGAGLIAWAAFVGSPWGQGLLINMGTALLLLVPIFLVQQALERSIKELRTTLSMSVEGYGAIRALLPKGDRRTDMMELYLATVQDAVRDGALSRVDVEVAARGGSADRTVALAMMAAKPDFLDPDLVRRSLIRSENGNEQYWAMSVADATWDFLPSRTRAEVLKYLRDDNRVAASMKPDSDRSSIRARILAKSKAGEPD